MLLNTPYETVSSIVMTAFWSAVLSVSCCVRCDGMCAFDLMCKVLAITLAAQTFACNIDQQCQGGLVSITQGVCCHLADCVLEAF